MTSKQTHLRTVRGDVARGLRWMLAGGGAVLLMLFTACNPATGPQVTAEIQESQFQRGQQALRGNQNQVALEAFLKVIEKREEAPMSHLEAGNIYLNHMKDPIAAIYHFRRHLELQPNGLQAPRVRELIEKAKIEFARMLPGNPLGAQYDRLELMDAVEKYRAENNTLRSELERVNSELAQLRGVGGSRQRPPQMATNAPVPVNAGLANVAPVEPAAVEEVVPVRPAPAPQPPTRPAPANNTPRAGSGRTYTTQRGDTLSSISRQFYGTPGRFREIYELNRDRLSDPNQLQPGVELRLP